MILLASDLMTNVAEIDEQHQELFNHINSVAKIATIAMVKEKAEQTLDFLGRYIETHFDYEEELQQKYNYPKYNWHREMHRWYIAEFHRLKNEYNENGPSIEFVELLDESIINWIIKHIGNVDVALGKYIREQRRKL